MKKRILAIVALAVLVFGAHALASRDLSRIETTEDKKTANVLSVENKTAKPAEKQPESNPPSITPATTPEPTPVESTPAPVVDPNGCEAKGQWWRADNYECIPKSVSPAVSTPAPSQPAAQAQIASTSGVEQWRALTAQYFGSETDYALRIMQCESGGNTAAHSPTNDYGLMQVNSVHAAKVGGNLNALYDPATNLQIAKQIRDGSGWGAWSCSRKV